MEVFISWSGETSRKLGEVLNNWIPVLLQSARPYYTPESIDKGKRWLTDILQKLSSSSLGIICLTADNLEKPWILFEAGALGSKLDDSKVCPMVFGIPKSSVKGPLTMFQITEFTESDFKKLIKSINNELGQNKVAESVIDKNFNAFFKQIDDEVNIILESASFASKGDKIRRSMDELIEELVENSRSLISFSSETLSLIKNNQKMEYQRINTFFNKRYLNKQGYPFTYNSVPVDSQNPVTDVIVSNEDNPLGDNLPDEG